MFKEINKQVVEFTIKILTARSTKVKISHIYQFYSKFLGYKSYQIAKSKNVCFYHAIKEVIKVSGLSINSVIKMKTLNVFDEIFKELNYSIDIKILNELIDKIPNFNQSHTAYSTSRVYLGKTDRGYNIFSHNNSPIILGEEVEKKKEVLYNILHHFLITNNTGITLHYWTGTESQQIPCLKETNNFIGINDLSNFVKKIKNKIDNVKELHKKNIETYNDFMDKLPVDIFIIDGLQIFKSFIQQQNIFFDDYLYQRRIFFIGIDKEISLEDCLFLKTRSFSIESSILTTKSSNMNFLTELNLKHILDIDQKNNNSLIVAKNDGKFAYFDKPLFNKEQLEHFINQKHPIRNK